ncbi:MAG: M1 family metallopeptidase [Rubripirellula sp.]|nr:M1 family metallopeptidase [Rubripirellula sp.]
MTSARNPLRLTLLISALFLTLTVGPTESQGQHLPNSKHSDELDRFFQIESWLPTPNAQRTASGAPGPEYWQQRADYDIDITLDDQTQRLSGIARIKYHNQSPHTLRYIWVQLDQNRFTPDSDSAVTTSAQSLSPRISFNGLNSILARSVFEGGYKIESVTNEKNKPVTYSIIKTMMRIDLDQPLTPGMSTDFEIRYSYNIVDAKVIRARGGYEYFEEDKNYIYEIAQWFPRVVSYTDYKGWQHKQFLGRGEFTLELGDYVVRITTPGDMIVAATGELQNAKEVLDPQWIKRLKEAESAKVPQFIVTPEEAKQNQASKSKQTKTWIFSAKNVRDFAFAASRKFIWDAMGVDVGGETVLAMSYYPNEAEPLWSQYSTESIAHTLEVYGRYSFEYPYPVAISVNGPVYGMEYPMLCFNGPRPEKDGTYSKATKYGLISVVIHEVGHNFFPMIVNSDERQWTWMDEGLNTFLQYLAEQEWEEDYPSRRGEPRQIVPYMRGGNQRPIMTGSEEILQFGPNAYSKPATALNILRETILGRELFDFAFKEYARRWKFKRPTPSDFFRTMEDASGIDLDWFWRGWFFSTDHVDLAIDGVKLYVIDSGDPDEGAERKRKDRDEIEPTISVEKNQDLKRRIDWQPGLKDFYNSSDYDELAVEESARKSYLKFLEGLDDKQKSLLKRTTNFYEVTFSNVGGLVMPIIVRIHYVDNSNKLVRIPAEIWRSNSQKVRKLLVSDKEIVRLELDPKGETADTEVSNNHWPPRLIPSRFKLFKDSPGRNPMQKTREAKKAESNKPADKQNKNLKSEAEQTGSKKPSGKPANDSEKSPSKEKTPPSGESKQNSKPKSSNRADS